MRRKMVGLFGILSVCALVAACGNPGGEQTPTPTQAGSVEGTVTPEATKEPEATATPTPEPTPETASHSVTTRDLTITITTDKKEYAAGENIQYTILIENNRLNWNLNSFEFEYSNSDTLVAADGAVLPYQVPQIKYGETYTLSGVLTAGNAEESNQPEPAAKTFSAECDSFVIRPYVKVVYAGEEVTVRAIMDVNMLQQRVNVKVSQKDNPKKITCHDPSIFVDFDGTYYIFGTHMVGGYSSDLRNWTNIEGAYRASYTQEVKDQIREWNRDENSTDWYDNLWAPDIIYNEVMGKYCMYLSANGEAWKSNIVLLTADKVDGPYEFAGTVVYGGFGKKTWGETDGELVTGAAEVPERYITYGIGNGRWGDMWPNCIDPCVFYDDDGKLWMSYGSWSGGIFMLELDEETGLRDYTVTYECNEHSDAYFGTKIAGGAYVSGEASYIEKIGDYYWLFISYGYLEAASGYNVRVFRSDRPDGGYVDALGNDAFSDSYVHNYNLANKGVRLFGGYKWRTFTYGEVAQGHNSAFVDNDGKAYMVYHTRTSNGTEGHYVKTVQLFLNKEGWLCAAPYATSGEDLDASRLNVEDFAGQYEIILHKLDIDYEKLETVKPKFVNLNADGTLTGEMTGTWALEEGTSYITLTIDGVTYSGVALYMNVENTKVETSVFTALGKENQLTIWGSKTLE